MNLRVNYNESPLSHLSRKDKDQHVSLPAGRGRKKGFLVRLLRPCAGSQKVWKQGPGKVLTSQQLTLYANMIVFHRYLL